MIKTWRWPCFPFGVNDSAGTVGTMTRDLLR